MSTMRVNDAGGENTTLYAASLSGETVPRRVLLAPWGRVESTHGEFVVDDESGRLVVEAFERHGTDLPIDYEHQTLGGSFAAPDGKAPAAGWIKRLVTEPGVGLLAEIEWTGEAARLLAAKEYRYLSPVAVIRKQDRKLVAVHSAALTNKPAIVGMPPIVNRDGVEHSADAMAHLRAELELSAEADAGEVLLAASRRLADLGAETRRQRARERIEEAQRCGKLSDSQREWAEALIAADERLFDEWFRAAPVIVQPGRSIPPGAGDENERRRCGVAARARAEFRANRALSELTSEEAYVADSLREAAT